MDYVAKGAIRVGGKIGVRVRNLEGYTDYQEDREEPTNQIAGEAWSHPRFKPMAVHSAIVPLGSNEASKIQPRHHWPRY